MKKLYQILDNHEKLKKIAFWSIALGLLIIVLYLLVLCIQGFFNISSKLDTAIIGQFGDFIGGIVGSLWSLASVLLFVAALKMQQTEISNQKIQIKQQQATLNLQKDEFEIERITNLIFKLSEVTLIAKNEISGYPSYIKEKGIDAILKNSAHDFLAKYHLDPKLHTFTNKLNQANIIILYQLRHSKLNSNHRVYLIGLYISMMEIKNVTKTFENAQLQLEQPTRKNGQNFLLSEKLSELEFFKLVRFYNNLHESIFEITEYAENL
jgi:hypothetical protein